MDYGLTDYDRLESELELTRTTRDTAFRGALLHYDSLLDGEDESQLPTLIGDVSFEQRVFPELAESCAWDWTCADSAAVRRSMSSAGTSPA